MNSSNPLANETAGQHYMRQFVDYLDHGIDFPELSQIRQLDICLQGHYHRIRELLGNLNQKQNDESSECPSESQTMLMNLLKQIKMIGDRKMQLSQQMLDATERQSKKLKMAHQKYLESINQANVFPEVNPNEIDSDSDNDSEIASPRSSSAKSLWKRRAINSTMNVKRKCLLTSEQTDRDRKKPIQTNGNGRKLRMNTDSSNTQSDETTYCLCSQLSYGSMILCDNKSCDIKWFHFNCVNLTVKPKGKWFCPSCRENRN